MRKIIVEPGGLSENSISDNKLTIFKTMLMRQLHLSC